MKPQDPEEDFKKQYPNLFGMDKKNPFSVPENYFEDLPGSIQSRIQQEEQESWLETLKRTFYRPQWAFALLLLLLLTAGGWFFFSNRQVQPAQREMALTADELKNAAILGDIDEFDLLDEYASLEETASADEESKTEIENYLIENHTDLNQLINEL